MVIKFVTTRIFEFEMFKSFFYFINHIYKNIIENIIFKNKKYSFSNVIKFF